MSYICRPAASNYDGNSKVCWKARRTDLFISRPAHLLAKLFRLLLTRREIRARFDPRWWEKSLRPPQKLTGCRHFWHFSQQQQLQLFNSRQIDDSRVDEIHRSCFFLLKKSLILFISYIYIVYRAPDINIEKKKSLSASNLSSGGVLPFINTQPREIGRVRTYYALCLCVLHGTQYIWRVVGGRMRGGD